MVDIKKPVKRILLVEDELFIRELYEHTLKQAGYEVVSAGDGEEALSLLNSTYDLILLDIMLPKIHGIDVLKKIKETEQVKNIPVVLLTNLGQETIIKDAFKIGAAGYLLKMRLTPYEIADKVEEFLNNPNYKMNAEWLTFD